MNTNTTPNQDKCEPEEHMNNWLLVVPTIYLAVLGLALWYFRRYSTLDVLGLSIPLVVLWFGALGGVVASLQGIFFYNRKWKKSFTIWHVFSGIIGATFGLASYLFLVVIVNSATGSTGTTHTSSTSGSLSVYALAAFALGYGQSQFHAMMDRVFNVMFQPSKLAPKPSQSSADSGDGQVTNSAAKLSVTSQQKTS